MKNVLKYLLLALIAVSQLFACGGSDDEKTPADNFDVQFTVPGSVDVTEGGECTFAVSGGGKSPLTTDTFILESDAGTPLPTVSPYAWPTGVKRVTTKSSSKETRAKNRSEESTSTSSKT